jgi:hypothetical protein
LEENPIMDREHSRWIVILLAGIFFILLVGREAAQISFQTLLWIAIPLLIVYFVVGGIWFAARDYYEETVLPLKEAGSAWLYKLTLFAAGLVFFGSLAIAGLMTWVGSDSFEKNSATLHTPLISGLYLGLFSGVVFILENIFLWVSRRIASAKLTKKISRL